MYILINVMWMYILYTIAWHFLIYCQLNLYTGADSICPILNNRLAKKLRFLFELFITTNADVDKIVWRVLRIYKKSLKVVFLIDFTKKMKSINIYFIVPKYKYFRSNYSVIQLYTKQQQYEFIFQNMLNYYC